MAISLYDAIIPSFQQILRAMSHLLDKGEAHCKDNDLGAKELIGARLHAEMLPFSYQIKATTDHSIGAIEGVRKGVFSPLLAPPPDSFAALNEMIDGAKAVLAALDPAEIDGFIGQDMRFEFGEHKMPFTAENFLLSFSQPNFYFHAATAYDVLRMKGVKLGKLDFLGALRMKD